MKNLRKTMLSIASIAACLSAETFAMQYEGEETPVARAAAGSASLASYSVPPLEAGQSYEAWLEARIQSFTSSPLFSILPEEDKPGLEKSLKSDITSSQKDPHIFYNPGMENDPRMAQLRCLNAELAILWFETSSVVGLAKRAIRIRNEEESLAHLLTLAENTEEAYYDTNEVLVKKEGQRIATEIVETLLQSEEARRQRDYFADLRKKWGRKLEETRSTMYGIVGFPADLPQSYRGHIGLTAEYCRLQMCTHPTWRYDLRRNRLLNLQLETSPRQETYMSMIDELRRLTIQTYNELVEEEALEKIAVQERALQEEREARARASRLVQPVILGEKAKTVTAQTVVPSSGETSGTTSSLK